MMPNSTETSPLERAMERELLRLDDPMACDIRQAGAKAARLATLRQRGYRVPDGCVVPVPICAEMTDGLSLSVPDDLAGEHFAVRSSGVAEDGYEHAMAGRYRTELNVARDEIGAAVRRCLQAARLADAKDGRDDHGIAILIQPMVDADCAGVAFSKNPVTGDDERLVSAVAGLGEPLVSGLVTGEDWTVAEDGPTPARDAEVLDGPMCRQIADLAARIADEEGFPQDIEWAVLDGELHLLQARPITALPVPPPQTEIPLGTWVKDETHYPNGVSPLSASVYLPAIADATEYAFGNWGLMVETSQQLAHRHEGYMRIVPLGGKEGPPPPAFVLGILTRLVPPIRKRVKVAEEAVRSKLGERVVREWREGGRAELEASIRAMHDLDLAALEDQQLVAHFDACEEITRRGQRVHFMLFVPYAAALYELSEFCREHLGWSTAEALDLLSGLSEETSGPSRDLAELGRQVASNAEALARLQAPDVADEGVVDALEAVDGSLATQWRAFVHRWGHRVLGYDPNDPTLAERPGILRRRVIEAVEHTRDVPSDSRRHEAEERAQAALDPAHVAAFDSVLARARDLWPLREENVAITDSMTNAVVRYAALEIGRRLVRRGALDLATDAGTLSKPELVEALLEGRDERATVRRRHAERAWVAAHPGPRVLAGEEHPMPNLRFAPRALRKTSGALMWFADQEFAAPDAPPEGALGGTAASPGVATGTVRIINGPDDFHRVRPGDIMVCPTTTPAWTIVFPALSGLIAEGGGVLAHAAIAAREHHIPAVLALAGARTKFADGELVEIDGTRGVVRRL